MSDALSARIVRAIGNYGMAVGRGEHALNEEILEIVRDVAELERQLAEAQKDNERAVLQAQDALLQLAEAQKDALQSEDAWCNQIGEVKDV